MPEDRPTVSPKEAGKMLGVSHDTVKNYWKRGWIEGYQTFPGLRGRVRLYRDSIEAFDKMRKSQPTQET